MSDLTITAPPATLPVGSWVLVGGLMVQLHARAAGVDAARVSSRAPSPTDAWRAPGGA